MKAETYDQLRITQHLDGLNKLLDVTSELVHYQGLDDILRIVTEGACAAHQCDRASLFLFDEERGDLYTRIVTELEISEIRRELGESIVGWVAQQQQLLNVPVPRDEPRWDATIDVKTGYQTRNILATPLISVHDGKLLGVLQLLNRYDGPFDECDEKLLQAFAAHAGNAIERQKLLEEARHSHELEVAIDVGRKIQTSFLPESVPRIPNYEVAAWWEPAEAVSGDYYDFLRLPDNRLAVIVADVSGHGVGPSLIMASFRAMLKVLARTRSRSSKLVSQLAECIYPDLTEGRFITAIFVALCPSTHEVNFTNAGHAPAFQLIRATGEIVDLETTGMPIGAVPDLELKPAPPRKMEPGDLLILATDGIIELRDSQGEMFGSDRFKELVRGNQHLPAEQLRDVIRKEILDFHPHQHPPDDITLVIVERKNR